MKGNFFFERTEMEINMLSYIEAQKTDKRGCFKFYLSLIFIFIDFNNEIFIKINNISRKIIIYL